VPPLPVSYVLLPPDLAHITPPEGEEGPCGSRSRAPLPLTLRERGIMGGRGAMGGEHCGRRGAWGREWLERVMT